MRPHLSGVSGDIGWVEEENIHKSLAMTSSKTMDKVRPDRVNPCR